MRKTPRAPRGPPESSFRLTVLGIFMGRFTTLAVAVCLAVAPAAAADTATLGTWGFDAAGRNTAVQPGDDFFRYAGGKWLASTEIPADRSRFGVFDLLTDRAERDVRVIIDGVSARNDLVAGTDERKVADLYSSFMDSAAIEKAGLAPLTSDFKAIDKVRNARDLSKLLGSMQRMGVGTPVATFVSQDAKQPEQYTVLINQAGLGMPDRDYYLTENWAEVRGKYRTHIANMLRLAGFTDPEKRAATVFAIEEQIAKVHWSRVESRDADKTYNKWPREQLAKQAPGLDWPRYLQSLGVAEQSEMIVRQPSAITGISALVKQVPIADWRDYLRFRLLSSAAGLLPEVFVAENFEFYGKTLSGTPQIRERWRRGVSQVEGAMGEAVGRLYVEKHFPPAAKARMDELVRNVVEAYRQRITNLDWMGPETRQRALDKLSKFTPKIGYPTKWRDYGKLEIVRGDALGNARRANQFEFDYDIAKLGKPVDRTEWFMTPQTVNAYYSPPSNEIVFPAAILQPPFFDMNADDAVNYGGIGGVIGHEIGHGFDDQGSKYDGDGVLRSWWTEEDRKRFQERTGELVAQYSGFEPLPGLKLNGALGLGENIGDLGGLQAALFAYRLSLQGKPAPIIDGLSGEQRFFLGWAQVWRVLYREPAMRRQVQVGPHSPGEFRVNGVVRNIDAWYEAFNIQPTDKLYLPPEQRVRIW
jgi:putative endopeptidase